MTLWSLALRTLAYYRARALATGLGVALAVASLVALIGLARGLEDALFTALEVRGTDLVVTEAGAVDIMSSIVPATMAEEFGRHPDIAATAAELTRMTSIGDAGSALIVAWKPGTYPWQELDLLAGRLPTVEDTDVAVIGSGFAERYQLSVGDRVELFQSDFSIIGEIGSSSALTRNLAFLILGDVQRLTFRDGKATSLNLRLRPGLSEGEKDSVLTELRQNWPNHAIEETRALAQGYVLSRVANVLSLSISLVALASAALMIFNTISLSVSERRGEIAIMQAVGWSRARTVREILLEGMILSLIAGVVGASAGSGAALLIARAPAVLGYLAPQISFGLLAGAVLLSLLIGFVASLVPALRVTAQSPAEILRGR